MVAAYAEETEATPFRVNLYDPGPTRTDMRFKAMPGENRNTLPTPEDVAKPIPYWLSPDCDLHGARLSSRDARPSTS
jgi:NAD(P)-dependent dehydrogenase (short-subunit alcohol dehydrogenase family)